MTYFNHTTLNAPHKKRHPFQRFVSSLRSNRQFVLFAFLAIGIILSAVSLPGRTHSEGSPIEKSISFSDNFDNGYTSGWRSVDNGSNGTPNWHVTNGQLVQTNNVNNGTSTTKISQSGTYFVAGNSSWKNYDVSVTAQPTSTGEVGIVFRYVDMANYYRFSISHSGQYMRLVRKVNSTYKLLAQVPLTQASSYRIRALVVGSNMQIFVNDIPVASVIDTTFSKGLVGTFTWNTAAGVFDDVAVNIGGIDYFTIAVVPDTQYEAQKTPSMMRSQMKWLAANRGPQNIVMMLHEGDIVNDQIYSNQWTNAAASLRYIDGKLPFTLAAGNHDLMNYTVDPYAGAIDASWFNTFIGGFQHYNVDGSFKPDDFRNTYQLTSIGGVDMMILSLEFGARDDVLAWASGIVDSYPNRHVILLTHDYLSQRNEWRGVNTGDRSLPTKYDPALNNGVNMWNEFVKQHSNVQFVFNGHVSQKIDADHPYSVGRLVSQNDAGRSVYQVLTNFQTDNNGNGYLRLFRFYPSLNKVAIKTYSPYLNTYRTSSLNQFTFSNVDLGPWTGQ